MSRLRVAGLLCIAVAALAVAPAIAQHASKSPTAAIDVTPRTVESLGLQRHGSQDATIAGGGSAGIPDSRVTLPTQCDFNPTALGCPGYCDANPSDTLNCRTEGTNPPPVTPPPVFPPEPALDHCGEPIRPGGPNGGCQPVAGGWQCPGRPYVWYVCR